MSIVQCPKCGKNFQNLENHRCPDITISPPEHSDCCVSFESLRNGDCFRLDHGNTPMIKLAGEYAKYLSQTHISDEKCEKLSPSKKVVRLVLKEAKFQEIYPFQIMDRY